MAEDMKERMAAALDRLERFQRGHGPLFRLLWAIAGAAVLLAGLAMVVLPGPAIVVLPLGLAMLAAVFPRARGLLNASVNRGVDARQRIRQLSWPVKLLAGLAIAAAAAGAVVLIVS